MSYILAILGLAFLVFIHELGHYFMALRVGMKVEAFSIGFGKPILKWMRNGVEWRLCILPFGGYVKIAGMQKEKDKEPHEIEGGFFQKKPSDRIKVAVMGPLVNIVFAFVAFSALWFTGGRLQPFQKFTQKIGWVAPESQLYKDGVRPGDVIRSIDGKSYTGIEDLLYTLVTRDTVFSQVKGYKMDYPVHQKTAFNYEASIGEITKEGRPLLFVNPAQYLINSEEGFFQNFPVKESGIQKGDRLFWVNGEYVFSQSQLASLLQEPSAFLTVEREGKIFHSKIPLAQLQDFNLSPTQKGELDDWKHFANLKEPLDKLTFLPYFLSDNNEVIKRIDFIDKLDQKRAFLVCQRCAYFHPLQPGDQIVALNGKPVKNSLELLQKLQKKEPLIIVEREPNAKAVSWKKADKDFDKEIAISELNTLVQSLGTDKALTSSGNFFVLSSFEPLQAEKVIENPDKYLSSRLNSEQKKLLLSELKKEPNRSFLGLNLQDKKVEFNPNPFALSWMVIKDVGRTLSALVQGNLNAKHLAGPVGILHMVQASWLIGAKEALYWLGLISLNLAILNLLPIPILDGGHITFSVYEMATKKRISAKTMERMSIPFFFLVIAFFIYVTYHDIFRLISYFFS